MNHSVADNLLRRILLALLLGGLALLVYAVLRLFLAPLAWAAVLVYVSWPLYGRLQRLCGGRAGVSALIMTLLLAVAFILPLLAILILLRGELSIAYAAVAHYLANGRQPLPAFLADIPGLGDWLQSSLNRLTDNPVALKSQVATWLELRTDDLFDLLGGIGRNAAKFGFALLAAFFLYRDGASLLLQLQQVLRRFIGGRIDAYFVAIGDTVRAVVYGLVLTALAQGTLAGLGYWAAGVAAPALLAALTVLVALVPFGTPLVWGTIGVWLLLNGQTAAGVGLLLWGALAVSWIDNLVRPLVISAATRIPFLLVMFGVLGGLAAFGLIGLFLGPVILAILMAVWREWLEETQGQPPAAPE